MRYRALSVAAFLVLSLVVGGLSVGAEAVDINLEFDSEPAIGIWCPSSYSGGVYATFGCEISPLLGLIPDLPHDSLQIETQVLGDGIGIVFGYRNSQNYFAFYKIDTGFNKVDFVLVEVSESYAEPRELASVPNPQSAEEVPGAYMKVVISEGHVECFFNELSIISVATERIPILADVGIYKSGDIRTAGLNFVYFLRISTSNSGSDPYDDGSLTYPLMELRNGMCRWEEKSEEVEHVITVFIKNAGEAAMHNVRYWAGLATYSGSDRFWDQDQRNIGTLEPQESKYVRITLSGPLYETTCPIFEATYDEQSGEPLGLEWDCY